MGEHSDSGRAGGVKGGGPGWIGEHSHHGKEG